MINDSDGSETNQGQIQGRSMDATEDPFQQLDTIRRYLPAGTAKTWITIAPVIPASAYLMGGTALAVHLQHRMSLDLDFFTEEPFDVDSLSERLSELGPFVETQVATGTLNGLFEGTKVQFLEATSQTQLEDPINFAGIRVASLTDIFASKLKVLGDRGTIRDYYDLMVIERETGLRVEEGLGLFVSRYNPRVPEAAVAHIVRALGYLDDVEPDPQLPLSLSEVKQYWEARVRTLGL